MEKIVFFLFFFNGKPFKNIERKFDMTRSKIQEDTAVQATTPHT